MMNRNKKPKNIIDGEVLEEKEEEEEDGEGEIEELEILILKKNSRSLMEIIRKIQWSNNLRKSLTPCHITTQTNKKCNNSQISPC